MPQIKKHYKLLSLKYHPDKVADEDKEEAQERFVDITKAYKVLTDEDVRKNYEEWGHPDGKQSYSLGIALPAWLVEGNNGNWVLLVYGVIFGLALPFFVGRWWYRSQKYTKDQIQNRTMALFFRELREGCGNRAIVEVLCAAQEFKEECDWQSRDDALLPPLADAIRDVIDAKGTADRFERSKKFPQPYWFKTYILLQAHIHRVPVHDAKLEQEQSFVIQKLAHLLYQGVMQIAQSRGWMDTVLRTIDISQQLVQGQSGYDSALLQLPYMTPEIVKHCRTRKRAIRTVRQLVELDDADRRSMLRDLTDEQYIELVRVAREHPLLRVPQKILRVIGDNVITPGSIVTFLVKLDARQTGDVVDAISRGEDEDESRMTAAEVDSLMMKEDEELLGNGKVGFAHAPRFPLNKKPYWWVVFGDLRSNSMITKPERITDVNGVAYVKYQFQVPPRVGIYPFAVFVKSDTYIGQDFRDDVVLEVVERSELPDEDTYEDEISEPDEDTIAGQMAAMRAQQQGKPVGGSKKGARQRRDSDTSEDDD